MKNFLWNNETAQIDLSLLVLRLAAGGMMVVRHGWPKLQKILSGNFEFADPIGIGPVLSLTLTTFAEFVCAIFLIIGFKSRLASIPLMFAMLVAAFIHHADDPFNRKEFPLLYFAVFLVIFLSGSGRFGVERS